mmetsp:Transcript_13342/g.18664  ORF Transcript_13342/g.18664 Transcript_13342/m.18664 type:complete len:288 (-) Transcript_13342:4-867(-)
MPRIGTISDFSRPPSLTEGNSLVLDSIIEKRKNAVCKISLSSHTGTGFLVCTQTLEDRFRLIRDRFAALGGSALSSHSFSFILTNNHVVDEKTTRATATFKYVSSYDRGATYNLRPDIFLCTNKKLDYTFVACERVRGVDPLPISIKFTMKIGTDVTLVGHRGGGPRQTSHSRILNIQGPYLHIKNKSGKGASGSPLFFARKNDWHVVGLHHSEESIHTNGGEPKQKYRRASVIWNILVDAQRQLRTNPSLRVDTSLSTSNALLPTKGGRMLSGLLLLIIAYYWFFC